MTKKAVFLDRDGVLNRVVLRNGRPHPPAGIAELEILPGVPEALERLRSAGFRLIVVTNQPDVARGTQTRSAVEQINAALAKQLPLDEFRVCFHDSADNCLCRKPAPGMLLDAAKERGLEIGNCYMIGDRWRDIDAGVAAGCRTVYIDCGYDEKRPANFDARAGSLAEAADWILGQERGRQ